MSRPIVNLDELQFREHGHTAPVPPGEIAAPEKFEARVGDVGGRIGAQKIGANVTIVPPGKRAYPRHNHHVNEEWFVVLDGSGEVRIGDTTHAIRAGDVICCVAGGVETAHQIVNTGSEELRYLALSTKQYPEICDYPDSGKFGVLDTPRGADKPLRFVGRAQSADPYWQGE